MTSDASGVPSFQRVEMGYHGRMPRQQRSLLSSTLAVWVGALLASTPVHAEDAPAGAPLDIVRLKNGGMVRGTIVELVPGKTVEITLPNGAGRTIPMDAVDWAGRASDDPGPGARNTQPPGDTVPATPATAMPPPVPLMPPSDATPPTVQGSSNTATLRLRAENGQEGLIFHMRTGLTSAHPRGGPLIVYQRLCTAPCEVNLEPGSYRFGLSLDENSVVGADSVVNVSGPSTLVGRYKSNTEARLSGVLLGLLAMVVGGVLAAHTTQSCDTTPTLVGNPSTFCHPAGHPYAVQGIVILVAGPLLASLSGLLLRDTAHVHQE